MMNPSMICIGHRGAMGYKPENTLASFALALEMGCPWVELDVYCVEGELLVIHDDALERTTNGTGNVMDRSLEYLRSLDAGDGQQIPTLREVIELIDRRAVINVELKGKATAAPVCTLLDEYGSRGWSTDDFLLSSFYHGELAQGDPRYRRGALFSRRGKHDYFVAAERLQAWSINLDIALAKAPVVDEAHERGYKVLVYTVNKPADIAHMRKLNVDGIFTNYPDRVL